MALRDQIIQLTLSVPVRGLPAIGGRAWDEQRRHIQLASGHQSKHGNREKLKRHGENLLLLDVHRRATGSETTGSQNRPGGVPMR
jgi:hypothetical protein